MSERHELPKKIKLDVEEGSSTAMKPGERIMFTLEAQNKEWIERNNKINDENMEKFTFRGPTFRLVSRKWVGVDYHPQTGNIYVSFKNFPGKDSAQEITGLKLDVFEFHVLQSRIDFIIRFFQAVEGKTDKPVEEVVKHYMTAENDFGQDYQGRMQVRFPLLDDIWITLKWNPNTKESMVDIRRGLIVQNYKGRKWYGGKEGICFVAGGFDYFARYILPKLRNAIRMFNNFHKLCRDTCWSSLFSTYEPKPSFFDWSKDYDWEKPTEDEDAEFQRKEDQDDRIRSGDWLTQPLVMDESIFDI